MQAVSLLCLLDPESRSIFNLPPTRLLETFRTVPGLAASTGMGIRGTIVHSTCLSRLAEPLAFCLSLSILFVAVQP
jgi:hypothetical protein